MSKVNGEEIWQDKDIRFDVDQRMLRLANGEFIVEKLDNVEDTKGNSGDRGCLRVTNLRIIWNAISLPRINLSIGFANITALQTKQSTRRLRNCDVHSIYVMAKSTTTNTKFEFIFSAFHHQGHQNLFNTINAVRRAYETSKLYRDIKMKGVVVDDNEEFRLLPLEYLIDRVHGAWNLSADQGQLGVLCITNIRVVWYAATNTSYSVSIPYLQFYSCRVRDSRFGLALVVETSSASGEYVLGFRIDPPDKLQAACKLIQSLMKASAKKPVFGVQVNKERPPSARGTTEEIVDHAEEDEIVETDQKLDAYAAYFAASYGSEARGPVFSEELGLAIESLKPGFTLSDLWNISTD